MNFKSFSNKALLSVFVMVLLASCQYEKLIVSIYTPPALELPPTLKSFMVSSRFVPASGPYEEIQWGAYQSVDSLTWELAEMMVDTLNSQLERNRTYYTVRIREPRMLRHNGDSLPEPLPWVGMATEMEKYRTDGAILLEGFSVKDDPVSLKPLDKGFEASLTVHVTTAWRIYEPHRRRMLDETVYHWKSEFKGVGESREAALADIPALPDAHQAACAQAARDYFNMFRPQSYIDNRFYHATGDSLLEVAHDAIENGNWPLAESKWFYLAYKSQDSIVRAKASYNMALACERDGRLNQAIAYARRSNALHPDRKTLDYINVLTARILDIEDKIRAGQIIRRW